MIGACIGAPSGAVHHGDAVEEQAHGATRAELEGELAKLMDDAGVRLPIAGAADEDPHAPPVDAWFPAPWEPEGPKVIVMTWASQMLQVITS